MPRAAPARLALLAALLLGFGLRVYRADRQEIWGDEGAKLEVVSQGLAHLFDPASEVHPRFFHLWLYPWHSLFGYNVFGLRMLPVLFGALGLAALYAWARALGAPPAARLGAVFGLALSPFHVHYSQDLTMYSLLFVALALSGLALARALQPKAGGRAWAWYALAGALSVHTHYYAVFALAAQNVYVLLWRRDRWKPWLASQTAIAALTLPWLFLQLRLLTGQAVRQAQDLTLENLGRLLQGGWTAFTVGTTCPPDCQWASLFFLLLTAGLLIWLLRRPPWRPAGRLLAVWLLLPPLCVWVFDLWLQHFGPRFLSISLPPVVLLLGWALAGPPPCPEPRTGVKPGDSDGGRSEGWPRPLRLAALAGYTLTSALALRAWYFDPSLLQSRYGEMMDLIERQQQPGDLLLLHNAEQRMLFQVYQPHGLDYIFLPRDAVVSGAAADQAFPPLVAGRRRVWLALQGSPAVYDPEHRAEAWLSAHGFKALYESYPTSYVTLYVFPEAAGSEALAPLEAQFAGGPRLEGYRYEAPVIRPGQTVFVTLAWRAVETMTLDYTVFTHLVDAAGTPVAQSDSQPASGTRPTSGWAPGERLLDHYALLVPAGLPAGEYSLRVGWYDWRTLDRLPLTDPGGPLDGQDYLFLGTIRVQQ